MEQGIVMLMCVGFLSISGRPFEIFWIHISGNRTERSQLWDNFRIIPFKCQPLEKFKRVSFEECFPSGVYWEVFLTMIPSRDVPRCCFQGGVSSVRQSNSRNPQNGTTPDLTGSLHFPPPPASCKSRCNSVGSKDQRATRSPKVMNVVVVLKPVTWPGPQLKARHSQPPATFSPPRD